jgi:ubiquinone/menaquinone biosynthesis C-methylase UbiE
MSWWMAAIYDRFMRGSEEACLARWRAELLRGLEGEVLEVGAGTGASLPHYPRGVSRLILTEPDRHMRTRLEAMVRSGNHRPTTILDTSLPGLPLEDGSCDAAVSLLVLCSVPDLDEALADLHRVLRPGGRLAFLEHVAAEGKPHRYKWQRRVEPIWKRVADGCHLTRRTEEAIRHAGFDLEEIQRESMRKAHPLVRTSIRGIARKR